MHRDRPIVSLGADQSIKLFRVGVPREPETQRGGRRIDWIEVDYSIVSPVLLLGIVQPQE